MNSETYEKLQDIIEAVDEQNNIIKEIRADLEELALTYETAMQELERAKNG